MHPLRACLLFTLLFGFAERVSADALTIANAGFEELYLGGNLPAQYAGDVPPGAFPTGDPPAGWTLYLEGGVPIGGAFVGVLNPGTAADHAPNPAYFPAGAPEGDNAALVFMGGAAGGNEFGIAQVLSDTLAANTRYTLTVEVGNIASGSGLVAPYLSFFDLDGFPDYRVQLLAGGVLLAEESGMLTPLEGVFGTSTLLHVSGDTPAQLGQPLEIRLISQNQPDLPGVDGLEVDFDDVQLDATAVPPIPIPRTARWLLVAGLLALLALWRRPQLAR